MKRLRRLLGALRSGLGLVLVLVTAPVTLGCQGMTSTDPPIVPIRNMHEQPRYDAQSRSRYFQDHRTMRPPLPGTVAQEMVADPVIDQGTELAGANGERAFVMTIPNAIVANAGGLDALARRGGERFDIFCVPCHGGLGDGDGVVHQTAPEIAPPTFHDERVRQMPDGEMYAIIRNGIRNMPAYGHQIPVADRWAIVAYVRALQISQADARTAALGAGQ